MNISDFNNEDLKHLELPEVTSLLADLSCYFNLLKPSGNFTYHQV
jgi:hypothetical protein